MRTVVYRSLNPEPRVSVVFSLCRTSPTLYKHDSISAINPGIFHSDTDCRDAALDGNTRRCRDSSLRRTREANEFDAALFSLVWAGFMFVFFSLSGSKLPSYIHRRCSLRLPCSSVQRLATVDGRRLAWQLMPVAVLAAAGLLQCRLRRAARQRCAASVVV
jgi:hypothetical protein